MLHATNQICGAGFGISIGIIVVHEINSNAIRKGVHAREGWTREAIQAHGGKIRKNLEAYARFFDAWGYSCPLLSQVQTIRDKGLPSAPPLIQALLLCEASQGVLMGVQDWDLVKGAIIWDIAGPNEKLDGFKGPIPCKGGEPVLRDSSGLLASYFQGPDRRTAIHAKTQSVVFPAFGAPGMPSTALVAALWAAMDTLDGAFNRYEGPLLLEDGHAISG